MKLFIIASEIVLLRRFVCLVYVYVVAIERYYLSNKLVVRQ